MDSNHPQRVLQLFVRHQPRIKGFIVALVGDFAAAEDVLQETFLVVQQKAGEFEVGSNFLGWVFQIARVQVLKHRTQRQLAELEDRLLHSATDRERFWELAEVHSLLHERMQGEVESVAFRSAKVRLQTPMDLSSSDARGGRIRRTFAERL